jgi:hypothetical protein
MILGTRFSTNNRDATTPAQQNLSTTYKSLIMLSATTGALVRGTLVDFSFGADGAPNTTDCQIVYDISRMTAVGTVTAGNVSACDGVSSASTTVGINATAEPTVTANSSLYMIPLNQRASLRVFLDVGFRWPATANAGLTLRALSPTYASAAGATTLWEE